MLYTWSRPPMKTIQDFEGRREKRGEVGALILWASWSVESLHYLDKIDAAHSDANVPSESAAVVNISHVRWATGTAITALDLCAAALAREYCGWKGPNEFDLRDFNALSKHRRRPSGVQLSRIRPERGWTPCWPTRGTGRCMKHGTRSRTHG
jgi:hypothetical protein